MSARNCVEVAAWIAWQAAADGRVNVDTLRSSNYCKRPQSACESDPRIIDEHRLKLEKQQLYQWPGIFVFANQSRALDCM